MPYKTVVVHLNNDQRVAQLLSAALQIALPDSAHLTGLFVVPHVAHRPSLFPALTQASLKQLTAAYQLMGEDIHRAFIAATANLPIAAEWRTHRAADRSYAGAVIAHARAADLVVTAQKESDWEYSDVFDIPDWLAVESGRPVLIVPRSGLQLPLTERVLVAWNNSRESARAVFDALPVLVRAKEVRVVCIEEPDKPLTLIESPAAAICTTLARYGVKCHAVHLPNPLRACAGDLLLSEAATRQCGLLIMGCFGRSRLREFILGGASQHLLKHATVPVLMAR